MVSVLDQGYPNLQYIVVDGGSTDGSVETIERYRAHLHRWCSESDDGHYAAINKGFSWSDGDIMAWINSDDMYCPWAFRTVAGIFEQCPEIQWLTTLYPIVWDYHGYCEVLPVRGFSRESYLEGRHIPWRKNAIAAIQQESTFWRRELWEKAGGGIRSAYSLAGDFDLWGMFYRHADLYTTVSPLGGFRVHERQRSEQRGEYLDQAFRSLRDHREALDFRPAGVRRVARALQIDRIPRVRTWAASSVGYRGWKVFREERNRPGGHWSVRDHRFF